MFNSFFADEGRMTTHYDFLPDHDEHIEIEHNLGCGDEGEVMLANIGDAQYAIKVFKPNRASGEEILRTDNILERVGVNPKLYYVGEFTPDYNDIMTQVLVVRKAFPIDLASYLRANPDTISYYLDVCRTVLKALIDIGHFDYDFSPRNVMLDDQGKVYFVDTNLGSVDDDPESLEEIMEYLPAMFENYLRE